MSDPKSAFIDEHLNPLRKNWKVINSLSDLTDEQRLIIFENSTQPFVKFEYLHALESNNCVGFNTGWQPEYLLYDNQEQQPKVREIGLLISYKKTNSNGEYVFDWAWADAYHRNGIHYYPKFTIAIPFTPVPGSRWLGNSNISEHEAFRVASEYAISNSYSSCHLLFSESVTHRPSLHSNSSTDQASGPTSDLNNDLKPDLKPLEREGHQFHWFNRNYTCFDDFLSQLTARKRKMIKKERASVQKSFNFEWRKGNEITKHELHCFYGHYVSTYTKRDRLPYLTIGFFEDVFKRIPESCRLLLCFKGNDIVASALYFVDEYALYGRYWGAAGEFELLHFEACYYQGIELAIKEGLKLFNPGTQGEHKISRGFEPNITQSYHDVFLPPFREAIKKFCIQEKVMNRDYMKACTTKLPYKTEL